MVDFVGMAASQSVCYISVTGLISILLQYFGICQTLVPGASGTTLWRRGATNKNQRVNMRKTSSMFACRQGRCRRHLRLGRAALVSRGRAAGIPRRLNAQLPLQIASSSACEQAVSRELLLPLTRDTVLAAVPWLRASAKARH